MDYQGNVIRPPSEARSILLQVTLGCTHNKCAFCGAYMGKRFGVKDRDRILADLEYAARHHADTRRLFLCDGDVLSLPTKRLEALLQDIREHLPRLTRIATYGNARGLRHKSLDELQSLREQGLSLIYMGLESGDESVLERMNKGVDSATMIREGRKVIEAGMKLRVTVLNGLGGVEGSMQHARETGRVLSAMDPHQVAALTLMLIPGTPLHDAMERGEFQLPDAQGILVELREMVAHTHLSKGLFLANHASNYLPIRARLPRDRDSVLELLDQGLSGHAALQPEYMRRL